MAVEIHKTAVVDSTAQLGKDIAIGPYAIIEAHTEIGDNTRIDAFAQVKKYTVLGAGNVLHSNAVVGGDPQDINFKEADTRLVMGDNNIIREFVTLNRGTPAGRGETTIGSGCMIMAYAHVAHDCVLADGVILVNCAMVAGHVNLGKGVFVGGLTGIHQHVQVGDYAFIGGMSGANVDVPPYTMAVGIRGTLRGLNVIGLRRAKMSNETIKNLKKAYVTIFRSGMPQTEALDEALSILGETAEVGYLVEFIKNSKRGVLPDISFRPEKEETGYL